MSTVLQWHLPRIGAPSQHTVSKCSHSKKNSFPFSHTVLVTTLVCSLLLLFVIAAIAGFVYRRKWMLERKEHELPIDPPIDMQLIETNNSSLFIISVDDLRIIDKLGEGAFGIVYLVGILHFLS